MVGDKRKEFFSIDVDDGDGQSVGLDDSVEIEYTEYLIEDGPQLTEFNGSNANRPLRIKIGKGKVPRVKNQSICLLFLIALLYF